MTISLWLPILLSAIALFFASFLSWMVLKLHKKDWLRLENEDQFMKSARDLGIQEGSYMFPLSDDPAEMKTEAFQQKAEEGPMGVITIFPQVSMQRNLGLTFAYFLAVSFCLAYLATLAIDPGAGFGQVFRFVSTAAFMCFLAAMIQHRIWFHTRVVGHVIEAIAYAAITGAIFGALWP